MNVKIAGGSKGVHANQGSCTGLVNYLQHEDLERLKAGQGQELFFDQTRDNIRGQEVIKRIDANRGQLGKTDAKYYSVIFSPSVKELLHLSQSGAAGQSDRLKAYIRREAMNEYAEGFGKGLSADDMLYFGKIHYERGSKGQENQLHVHLIVSRKDKANKKKLSPMTNHRGTEKGAVKGGFNREAFVSGIENRFDKSTGYARDISESFAYCKSVKSGDLSDLLEQVELRVAQEKEARQETEKSPLKQQKEEAGQERVQGRGMRR
ncbi:DUF5712 family protein [Mucilaginibacter arboris]|uniref:Clindamycin resistance transfer factor BtgB n=1 Tax=Mucilaginibacter arboris TaxID=2682090 RepID=A0A7K1T1P9_9SPHI|nr:DUF5712 family protein [Mucilaginibacter arboris]MVN23485.1 clindamycin resistance transfer factor BtgB [Mucilaginibacter arboris]